jgi:hypothetical protein
LEIILQLTSEVHGRYSCWELEFTSNYGRFNFLPTNFTNENVAFQTGHPWFSILTRTGVFKGKENHEKFPADLVIPFVSLQTIFVDAYTFFTL